MFHRALLSWLHGLAVFCRGTRPARKTRKTTRLCLEQLDDRIVPSTFTVNVLADTHAVSPTMSALDRAGHVSLRSAIESADRLGGDQTIQFDPTVFTTAQTIKLWRGLLDVKGGAAITIEGPEAGLTVSGLGRHEVFRVEKGASGVFVGLTIRGGVARFGGGIFNAGSLTLTGCTITANRAIGAFPNEGGGIFNRGELAIQNSVISSNVANWGGGIYNVATLILTNSTVSGNRASTLSYYQAEGGGICNQGGLATIDGCTITANATTSVGGGMFNTGILTVSGSTLSHNSAADYGGALYTDYLATLDNCTVSGNVANLGGGVFDGGGTTTLNGTTLSGNSARLYGGAIYSYFYDPDIDPLFLNNCTVAGNQAKDFGGGLFIFNVDVTLNNTTVSGNSTIGVGGGIYNDGGTLTLNNSIVAANLAVGIVPQQVFAYLGGDSRDADDIFGYVSPDSLNNLIGDGTGMSGISNLINGNQVGSRWSPINPLLAPLGDYGGLTQTMALLPGSPAIDAGENSAIPAGMTTDQRGRPRIVNHTVDIGAFEACSVEGER